MIAVSCSFACSLAGIFFFLERPKRRAKRVVVASGQILRHTPQATTSNAGATGIKIFHKTSRPNRGTKRSAKKIPAPISHTIACTNFQTVSVFADTLFAGIFADVAAAISNTNEFDNLFTLFIVKNDVHHISCVEAMPLKVCARIAVVDRACYV